jgi:hypothetical protein
MPAPPRFLIVNGTLPFVTILTPSSKASSMEEVPAYHLPITTSSVPKIN